MATDEAQEPDPIMLYPAPGHSPRDASGALITDEGVRWVGTDHELRHYRYLLTTGALLTYRASDRKAE